LIFITIYLNYILIPLYGIEGAAISSLIAVCLYNSVKVYYVYLKFKLHPISINTFKVISLILVGFLISFYVNFEFHPFLNIILNSILVSFVYISIVVFLKFSVDFNNLTDKFLGK